MKSRLSRNRSNKSPGLLGTKPARSSGPQNYAELGRTACGEVVAQQNEVGMFTP